MYVWNIVITKSKQTMSKKDNASSIDVAKRANVSQATVSRVLNHPEKVSEETRQKVYSAIDELRYIPNQNARDLVSGNAKIITLISGALSNPFFVDSTAEIVEYATSKGYKINVYIIEDEDIELTYQLVLNNRPSGIIMSCILYDDLIINQLQYLDLPFVSYNRRHKEKLNYVEFDNFEAGEIGCQLLFDKQCAEILWVGGRQDVSTFKYRFDGFCAKYQQLYQRNISDSNVINELKVSDAELQSKIEAWYQQTEGKKAIFAATDALAIRVMNITKRISINCPDDIGIIGIDNVNLSQHTYINLTTIGSEKSLGLTAIGSLIDTIEQRKNDNIMFTFPVKVFERGTLK